jgi:hypothetical protein
MAVVALALLASLLLAQSARPAASDWSVVRDPAWTNANVFKFRLIKAHQGANGLPRTSHYFSAWTSRVKPPAGRATATITRSFSKLEGDTVTLTFFGETVERDLQPHAAVALYVLCHILAPGQAEPGNPPQWVKIGEQTVQPTYALQTLTAKITGGACTGPVAIGHSREVTGARIQLLGATNANDHNHRTIYLTRFEITNGPTELIDDFTTA